MKAVLGEPSSDETLPFWEKLASSYHLILSIIFGIIAIHSKHVHIIIYDKIAYQIHRPVLITQRRYKRKLLLNHTHYFSP